MLLMLEVFTVEQTPYMVWFILGAFLAGSIPFGWLAAKANGLDLRTVGSGNIGGTNAWRALGWKWGLSVMVLDALKGFVPVAVWLAYAWGLYHDYSGVTLDSQGPGQWSLHAFLSPITMLIGLAAILGHTFTPWLKFRGGKGVATGAGVLIALFSWWSLIPLAVFGIMLGLTRMVSLSSIIAALSLAALSLAGPLIHAPGVRTYWPFAVLTAALVLWTHRDNIHRIIAGTEPRIGSR
jgi:acyl phosphate:glycerol-3-phosphate acyltransferase